MARNKARRHTEVSGDLSAEESVLRLASDLGRAEAELALAREENDILFREWRLLIDKQLSDKRVSHAVAIAGSVELGLPPVARRTLHRWATKNARILGIRRDVDPSAQQFLLAGLLVMHRNPRRKAVPPQSRKR